MMARTQLVEEEEEEAVDRAHAIAQQRSNAEEGDCFRAAQHDCRLLRQAELARLFTGMRIVTFTLPSSFRVTAEVTILWGQRRQVAAKTRERHATAVGAHLCRVFGKQGIFQMTKPLLFVGECKARRARALFCRHYASGLLLVTRQHSVLS